MFLPILQQTSEKFLIGIRLSRLSSFFGGKKRGGILHLLQMQNGLETIAVDVYIYCSRIWRTAAVAFYRMRNRKQESGAAAAVNRKCAVKLKSRNKNSFLKDKKESYTQSGKGLMPLSATAKP